MKDNRLKYNDIWNEADFSSKYRGRRNMRKFERDLRRITQE
jgi:hypothetical protein